MRRIVATVLLVAMMLCCSVSLADDTMPSIYPIGQQMPGQGGGLALADNDLGPQNVIHYYNETISLLKADDLLGMIKFRKGACAYTYQLESDAVLTFFADGDDMEATVTGFGYMVPLQNTLTEGDELKCFVFQLMCTMRAMDNDIASDDCKDFILNVPTMAYDSIAEEQSTEINDIRYTVEYRTIGKDVYIHIIGERI